MTERVIAEAACLTFISDTFGSNPVIRYTELDYSFILTLWGPNFVPITVYIKLQNGRHRKHVCNHCKYQTIILFSEIIGISCKNLTKISKYTECSNSECTNVQTEVSGPGERHLSPHPSRTDRLIH